MPNKRRCSRGNARNSAASGPDESGKNMSRRIEARPLGTSGRCRPRIPAFEFPKYSRRPCCTRKCLRAFHRENYSLPARRKNHFLPCIFLPPYVLLSVSLFLLFLSRLLFIPYNIRTCHRRFALVTLSRRTLVLTFECISHRGYVQFSATHLRDYSVVASTPHASLRLHNLLAPPVNKIPG